MARKLAVAAGGPLNLLPRSELSTFNHQAEALRAPLRQGCVLCFDGLGNDWGVAGADGGTDPALEPPRDAAVAAAVAALVREGYAAQLLLSCGVGLPPPRRHLRHPALRRARLTLARSAHVTPVLARLLPIPPR